jgi:hypothetical protein
MLILKYVIAVIVIGTICGILANILEIVFGIVSEIVDILSNSKRADKKK